MNLYQKWQRNVADKEQSSYKLPVISWILGASGGKKEKKDTLRFTEKSLKSRILFFTIPLNKLHLNCLYQHLPLWDTLKPDNTLWTQSIVRFDSY